MSIYDEDGGWLDDMARFHHYFGHQKTGSRQGRYVTVEELQRRANAAGLDYHSTQIFGVTGSDNLIFVPVYASKRLVSRIKTESIEDAKIIAYAR